MFVKLLIFSLGVCGIFSKQIPSFVHVCKRGKDTGKCFAKTFDEIVPNLLKGIPEMDLPKMDPLHFSDIDIKTGSTSSVNMDISLFNGTVYGLKHLKLKDVVMDFDKINFTTVMYVPQIAIEAGYKVNGKILLFEINGSGPWIFNASDLQGNAIWTGSLVNRKGQKHLNIDKVILVDTVIKNVVLKFENLFQDNDLLTQTVNNAINDNIPLLYDEMLPLVTDTLASIMQEYVNRVYRRFPFDQLYPVD